MTADRAGVERGFDCWELHVGAAVPTADVSYLDGETTAVNYCPLRKRAGSHLPRPFGALRPSLEKCTSLHTSAGWTREEVESPFGFTPERPADALLPTSDRQKHLRSVVHGRDAPRPESPSSPPLQSRRGPEPQGVCVSRNFGKRRRPPDEKRAGTLVPAQRRRNDRLFSSPGISP